MDKPIVIALDFESAASATQFLAQIDPTQCRVKIGKELFTASGPDFVKHVIGLGFDVFLDLKFHDIPNTVARAVAVAADMGVWMLNVHASGGSTMMAQSRAALEPFGQGRPLLIAVTVLTSMAKEDLQELGLHCEPVEQVKRLAHLTANAGLDGVVCSAAETKVLRQALGPDFCLVTPGIRRAEDSAGDQKRVIGPAQAMANGSSFLVVGRPITQSKSPLEALNEFNSAVAGVVVTLD